MTLFRYISATLLAFGSLLASARSNYTVHNVEGRVALVQGKQQTAITKGMELQANDALAISPGAHIEIHNATTNEVYTSKGAGQTSVMQVMLDARRASRSTASDINNQVRFGRTDATNTRQYTEGSIKRAMAEYDPEGAYLTTDARQIALQLCGVVAGTFSCPPAPVPVAEDSIGAGGLIFRVENTLDFPIYINVLKLSATVPGAFELSELGQPTGCYVLLPGQALSREQSRDLQQGLHLLLIAHAKFDIDDVLAATAELRRSPSGERPDPSLPLYLIGL